MLLLLLHGLNVRFAFYRFIQMQRTTISTLEEVVIAGSSSTRQTQKPKRQQVYI
jgi:hypothetical protein